MPLIASIVHTSNPYALKLTESFGIRWYGLAYFTGFVAGWLILYSLARRRRTPLTPTQVGDFATALIVGVLVGGRVGHVLFYEPSLLTTFTSSPPFWGLLAIHRGGMSSHGGIIGVTLATVWFARSRRVPVLHLGDLVGLIAPIGLGLGRWANWINGELWGKPLPAEMQAAAPWWSVKYPDELMIEPSVLSALPPPELARLHALVPKAGDLAAALRDACYRGDAKVIAAVEPHLTAHYPSNFLQAITDGPILFALMLLVWMRPRKPGIALGVFLMGYGVLRIVTEQFRVPDKDIFTVGSVTLPMTLSGLMVVIGAGIAIVAARRDVPRMGGLVGAAA